MRYVYFLELSNGDIYVGATRRQEEARTCEPAQLYEMFVYCGKSPFTPST